MLPPTYHSVYTCLVLPAVELNANETLAVGADYILVDGWAQSEG